VKYKYEFPVHQMTEKPINEFRYVYADGTTSLQCLKFSDFIEQPNKNSIIGWIYTTAEKTPILEDGKWYSVRHKSWEAASVKCVKCYKRGKFYDFFDADENAENHGVPVENYIVIAEMQEVAQ
jgi:hypothetical protein